MYSQFFTCLVMFMFLLSSADFSQNKLFSNKYSGTLSECQTVWTKLFAKVISKEGGISVNVTPISVEIISGNGFIEHKIKELSLAKMAL